MVHGGGVIHFGRMTQNEDDQSIHNLNEKHTDSLDGFILFKST